jgi:hypothetical protein
MGTIAILIQSQAMFPLSFARTAAVTFPCMSLSLPCTFTGLVLSRDGVTTDGVWIGNWIYSTLIDRNYK